MRLCWCAAGLSSSAVMANSASPGSRIRPYLIGDTRWFVSTGVCALLFQREPLSQLRGETPLIAKLEVVLL